MKKLLLFIGFLLLVVYSFSVAEAKAMNARSVTKLCEDYAKTKEFSKWKTDCRLMAAIAWQETRYKPKDFNPEKSGSYGLMQIQCDTAAGVGLRYDCYQLFDPQINMRFGMKYIMNLLDRHGPLQPKALFAAWNADRPIICKEYNPGYCYPGEFYNEDYAHSTYKHYNYLKTRIRYDNWSLNSSTNYSNRDCDYSPKRIRQLLGQSRSGILGIDGRNSFIGNSNRWNRTSKSRTNNGQTNRGRCYSGRQNRMHL